MDGAAIQAHSKIVATNPVREHLWDGPGFFLAKKNSLWGFTNEVDNIQEAFVKGQKNS
jgi:hypothetical protein